MIEIQTLILRCIYSVRKYRQATAKKDKQLHVQKKRSLTFTYQKIHGESSLITKSARALTKVFQQTFSERVHWIVYLVFILTKKSLEHYVIFLQDTRAVTKKEVGEMNDEPGCQILQGEEAGDSDVL